MTNWIETSSEPRRLYLAWQAPDHLGNRFRWAVATIDREEDKCVLRYLRPGVYFGELNNGKEYSELSALGYEGHPAFRLRDEVHDSGVMEVLMRRLPPRTRPDFRDFREQFRLSDQLELSDLGLLAQTEAKLPSDGFSVVDPLDPEAMQCELMLEVAGLRYYVSPNAPLNISIGSSVDLQEEPTNEFDSNAVQVRAQGRKIGFINRLQAKTFLRWLSERNVTAVLERVNGTSIQPRAFIFVKVRPIERIIAAE